MDDNLTTLESGLKSAFSLFNGAKIFQVPKYQRAYPWEKEHLDDFVDDLENQRSDRAYFLGTILLLERGTQEYFTYIDIIDGQQRMTTIVIFIRLLLNLLKAQDLESTIPEETYLQSHGEFKLRILPEDNPFFQDHILQEKVLPDGQIDTPSQRRLLNAKEHLKKRLGKYSLDDLHKFQKVLDKARVLTYVVERQSEAALIFETTNDRGKRLTDLEKIKSFMMYKAYLVFDTPELHIEDIQELFSKIYRDYDDIRDESVGEDTILQYNFTAFEKWRSGQSYKGYQHPVKETKDAVNSLIKKNKEVEAQDFIDRYSRGLQRTFRTMKILLLSPSQQMRDVLASNRPANFYPLLIKTWQLDENDEKNDFNKVARLAEIYAFRVLGIRAVDLIPVARLFIDMRVILRGISGDWLNRCRI